MPINIAALGVLMIKTSIKNLSSQYILLSFSILMFSCAKELPVVESESIQNNIFAISDFSKKVIVSNYSMQKESLSGAFSQVYAINETPIANLNFSSGPENLRPLFKNLNITLPQGINSSIEVKFKLTENYLVAYIKADQSIGQTKSISPLLQKFNGEYNIFHYEISSFGTKRREKNSFDEETRDIEYVETLKEDADYIEINPLPEYRTLGSFSSLDAKEKREILLKENFTHKIWTVAQLRRLFNNSNLLSESKISIKSFSTNDHIAIRLFRNNLYFYSLIKSEELIEKEKDILENNFNVKNLLPCKDSHARLLGIDKSVCYLRSEYKIRINPVEITPELDSDGQTLATIEFKTKENINETELIKINTVDLLDTRSELYTNFPELEDQIIIHKENKIDIDSEYLYVPSTHGTPREVVDASAFFQGTE